MSIRERMNVRAASVSRFLAEYWSKMADHPRPGIPHRLLESLEYSTLNGGKRLRPYLLMEVASLFGTSESSALPVAAAVELIHCYSLVHDDLPALDNDLMRRGKPSTHAKFGEALAVLCGDALQPTAFQLIAAADGIPATTRLQLVAGLANASGPEGMVGGQVLDIEAESFKGQHSVDSVKKIHALKTGALIAFCAEAGGMIGGVPPHLQSVLKSYGNVIGALFQITDDLLDYQGTEATTGKATQKDAAMNKATLIAARGVEFARSECSRLAAIGETTIGCLDFNVQKELRDFLAFVANRKS